MKKNYTGLEKTTDSGILAPGGRIQSYWKNNQGINTDFNKVVELIEDYNLTGIEFGNWVPQNERLSYVNDVYMGLPIMCDFLNVSKKNIGQNKISLAFGARGRRKSNAHFEPTTYAINLTRKKGRKSFLHEYIHAIDRIMYEATKKEYGTNPQMLFSAYFAFDGEFYLDNSRIFEERLKQFITEDGVRGAFARLFWNLCFYVETKNGKSSVKWSKFYDTCKRTGEYFAYPWEILARSMEAYFAHIYLKQDAKNEIRGIAKHTTYFSGEGVKTTIYPKAKLIEELKPYFDDVLKAFTWVLDANTLGKPNKSEPKFIPSSSIINEASDLDLAKLREKAKKKPEVKRIEKKKPEVKKVEKKKPELIRIEKKKPETKKVAQKSFVKTEENKYSIDNLFEQIKRGYYANSFNPEKRAKEDINTYNDVLKKKIDELKELGASDSDIDTFFNGFKTRLLAWYSALSRTMSSAVTGGSNFPVESNRKKMKSADNKYDEFLNFYNDYVKNYKKKNAEPITPSSELEKAQKKLDQEEKNLEMMKQVNAIIRKYKTEEKIVPEIVKLGIKETTAKELIKPDYANRIGFPTYSLQNTRQEIARLRQRVKDLSGKIEEGKDQKIKKYATINNGFIQIDFEQDRVQIIFDDKPSADTISALKRKGFKWSPSNKAWQRKYTQNTIRDVENLFKEEFTKVDSKEKAKKEEIIPIPEKYETEEYLYHPSLLSDYIADLRSGKTFGKYKINITEAIDELNDKWENKEFISWEFAVSILRDLPSFRIKFDTIDEKDFTQEFIWYCMFASQNILDHKVDKRVTLFLKKFKPSNLSGLKEGYSVFTLTKRNYEKFGKSRKKKEQLNLKDLIYVTERNASKDTYRPAMMGVYYDTAKDHIVMTDSYRILLLPTKYLENSIVSKLQKDAISAIGVKDWKNFDKIDEKYPPYENVLPSDETLSEIFTAYVDEELEKMKQLNHCSKFSSEIKISRQYVKFSKDGGYFAFNYRYFIDCMETFKQLGKTVVKVYSTEKGNPNSYVRKGFYLIADDIKILIMPVRIKKTNGNFENIPSFDSTLYDFENGSQNYPEMVPLINVSIQDLKRLQYNFENFLRDINKESLSDEIENDIQMFDNRTNDSLNIEQTKDFGFSDEITAPDLEVNSKYDLPSPIVNNNAEVVTIQQMKKNKIKPMQMPSKYKYLLGNVPNNFRMLLWGAPGHGKSSLALTIGNDIARKCKVLFVSAEESVQSATLQNRIKRFKANSRNLMFNDTTNPAIIESIIAKLNPKFIIIDSANVIQGKVEAIIELMAKYPEIGFIVIAQATKDHKRYSGLGSLAHAVDIVVNVKSGIATAEKNRYAPLGSMPVKGITI